MIIARLSFFSYRTGSPRPVHSCPVSHICKPDRAGLDRAGESPYGGYRVREERNTDVTVCYGKKNDARGPLDSLGGMCEQRLGGCDND